jgi:hypothetical protein
MTLPSQRGQALSIFHKSSMAADGGHRPDSLTSVTGFPDRRNDVG